MTHIANCLDSIFPILDFGREGAEFAEDVTPDVLEHLDHFGKETPERLERITAWTDELVSFSYYHKIAKLQDFAESHIGKKITLSIGSLLSTMIQNLSQIFQSINVYPNFTNAIDMPAVAIPFLILGAFTSALSFVIAAYSTHKVAVLQNAINNLAAAQENLDVSEKPKKETYQLTQDVLALARNKAIRNIVLSVLSISVFILSNVLSMGIPLMAIIGCCILVAVVKICMDIKATHKTKALCEQLQRKILIVGYGPGLDDPAFKKLMAEVIPVIQKETGCCLEAHARSFVDVVRHHHVA